MTHSAARLKNTDFHRSRVVRVSDSSAMIDDNYSCFRSLWPDQLRNFALSDAHRISLSGRVVQTLDGFTAQRREDNRLAMTRCRRRRIGVRERSGPDDRAVAHAPRHLAWYAAGRSCSCEPSVDVKCNRSDGTMFVFLPSQYQGMSLFDSRQKPLACARINQGVWIAKLETIIASKTFRAIAGNHHVRRMLHYRARQQHGVSHSTDSGHRTGLRSSFRSDHHRRIHFHGTIDGECRSITGVEQRIVFENLDARDNRIERTATFTQNQRAGLHGVHDCALPKRTFLAWAMRTCAAMNDQRESFSSGHSI